MWFLDGKDESDKTVSNPNIGYGRYHLEFAGGLSCPLYKIGISANPSVISIYLMGLADKHILIEK